MLRRLIIMRHAKSSWKGETSDHDRPLNKRGRREAPLVAAQLEARGWSPEVVLSSDSARTRETMARMIDQFNPWPQVDFTPALYLAGPHALREAVAGVADEVATVLALGHNPGWEEAVAWLAEVRIHLTTADAALLESSGDSWRDALRNEGDWQLVDVVRAGEIDEDYRLPCTSGLTQPGDDYDMAKQTFVVAILLLGLVAVDCASAEVPPGVKEVDAPSESFLVEDHAAFVLLPAKEKRTHPQPWIMYAPTLAAYPDTHEKWMLEQFVASGVAVAGIDAGEAYGSPSGAKLMSALYDEVTSQRGFATKPCLLGRSRGGLWVSNWAIAHPEKVAGIAGIYPVYDLRTYPGLANAAPAYGLTAEQLETDLAKHNPIARVDALAKAKIPVCIIHGDDDRVVPLKENSQTLADIYKQAGAGDEVELIVAKGQGHNFWEGFFRCQPLVDFAIERAKAGAK